MQVFLSPMEHKNNLFFKESSPWSMWYNEYMYTSIHKFRVRFIYLFWGVGGLFL